MPTKPTRSPLGKRLQDVRSIAENLSARELDRLADITEGHTSMIESGVVRAVTARVAAKLAIVLGVSLDWLVTGLGERPTERAVQASVESARAALAKRSAA